MYVNETYLSHADVGLAQLGGSSPIDRREGAQLIHRGYDEMTKIKDKLSLVDTIYPGYQNG